MGHRDRTQRIARAGAGGPRVSARAAVSRRQDPVRGQRESKQCGGDIRHAGCRRGADRRRLARGQGVSGDREGSAMNWINLAIAVHVLIALAIVGLVLLQHGKGADMGSGFGGGASGSLFGATGSANFLSRTTAVLAACFFASSLALAYTATRKPADEGGGVIDVIRQQQQQV